LFNDLLEKTDATVFKIFRESEGFLLDDGTFGGLEIEGIYDAPSVRPALFTDGPGVAGYSPRLTISSFAVAHLDLHDREVTRRKTGETFTVADPQPTGDGLTVLILSEDP